MPKRKLKCPNCVNFFRSLCKKNKRNSLEYHYTVDKRVIGRGKYGLVKRVTTRSKGETYAVKEIKYKSKNHRETIEREIELLKFCNHDNILRLKNVFTTMQKVQIVTPLLQCDLYSRISDIGSYTEKSACKIIIDLLSGMKYLHKNFIVHRDLKPENILLTSFGEDARLVIADLGFAKQLEYLEEEMSEVCGTVAYAAPEVSFYRPQLSNYNYKVDIWSLGIIIYVMVTGYHPFDFYGDKNNIEMWDAIRLNPYIQEESISPNLHTLLRRLLRKQAKQRPNIQNILLHPWFFQFMSDQSIRREIISSFSV